MSRNHIIGAVLVVLVLALGVFFTFTSRDGDPEVVEETAAPSVNVESEYEEGVHYITGTVSVPDRCISVIPSSTLLPDGVMRVDLSLSPDEGLCLELPTEVEFSTEVEAPEEAPLEVYVNGTKAQTP